MIRLLAAALTLCLAPGLALAAGGARFALAVGSNDGGPDRAKLWFAESDAQRMADALAELGVFAPADVEVLKGPDAATLRKALAALARRARASAVNGQAPLVFFYYSGHADPRGLRLARELLPYGEISTILADIPEGVRVAVVDACHSGALTQVKGAQPAPLDFEIPREPRADGMAIITSASAGEAAQESAALGGSFFTHHLTMGLRGPADADGDGRVTLAEGYRYAYNRTLAATSEAGVLPQHPTYAMRIAGKGEVVLVDLRKTRSALSFPAGQGKSWLVTHARSMEVMAEVSGADEPVRVALPPGRYRVERLAPPPRLSGLLELPDGASVPVKDDALSPVPVLASRQKGLLDRPATFAFGHFFLATPIMKNYGPDFGFGGGVTRDFDELTLTTLVSYASKGVDDGGVGYEFTSGSLHLAAGRRTRLGMLSLTWGLRGGATYAEQKMANARINAGLIADVGPFATVEMPLLAGAAMGVTLFPAAHSFRLNDAVVTRFSLQLGAALGWGF